MHWWHEATKMDICKVQAQQRQHDTLNEGEGGGWMLCLFKLYRHVVHQVFQELSTSTVKVHLGPRVGRPQKPKDTSIKHEKVEGKLSKFKGSMIIRKKLRLCFSIAVFLKTRKIVQILTLKIDIVATCNITLLVIFKNQSKFNQVQIIAFLYMIYYWCIDGKSNKDDEVASTAEVIWLVKH